jgi:hypothetical protein
MTGENPAGDDDAHPDDDELDDIAHKIRRYHNDAQAGLDQERDGFELWFESSMNEARELKRGRERFKNNVDFGKWLEANQLGTDFLSLNDRAALLQIANCPVELVREQVKNTTARNWQYLWRNYVHPEVVSRDRSEGLCISTKTPKVRQPQPKPENIVARMKWQRDGMDDVFRWCKDQFVGQALLEEEQLQLARDARDQHSDLVIKEYSDDDVNWHRFLEKIAQVDKSRRRAA